MARVKYTDPDTGRTVDVQRRARNKAHAAELRDKILRDIGERVSVAAATDGDGASAAPPLRTLRDLCAYYVEFYAKPAEFRGSKLVAGMRSFRVVRGYAAVIDDALGARSLGSLTYGDLRRFRENLLGKPTSRGKERSFANVHRVLSTFRAMLKIAAREKWIESNPFDHGRALISPADEERRERILSRVEEARLLAACDAPKRRHLRPLLICALDTGMRRGEILKLRWCDVDLESRSINVPARHTKTLTARSVPITARLATELARIEPTRAAADSLVFGVTNTVKTAFLAACRDAQIADFRFHDARHTAATRMIEGGMHLVEVSRILGHSAAAMTYRYTNADAGTVTRAADVLDRLNLAAAGEADAVFAEEIAN